MSLFDKNWIAANWVDFELKKYTLLSYLQKIENKYNQRKVYPYLLMLKEQLADLNQLRFSLENPGGTLRSKNLFIEEEPTFQPGPEMETILNITRFALPKVEQFVHDGDDLEAFVIQSVDFYPVGVLPCDKREGYLIFRTGAFNRVYQFQLRRITPGSDNEIYSTQLKTWFVQDASASRFTTIQNLKYELIRSRKDLPNPATYAVESTFTLPFPETLVPVGRKLL
jgi:hypothetical protein